MIVDKIYVNRFVSGEGWGTAKAIENDMQQTAGDPRVVIDTDGDAIAVWWQKDASGTHYNIYAWRYW